MAVMRCSVAIPDRSLFEGEATYVGVPGADGAFGVMPGHELMLALNKQGGLLTIDQGENGQDRKQFLIMGGATQVFDDRVTVLARYGRSVDEIDESWVRNEVEETKKVIADLEAKHDPQDQATLDTAEMKLKWLELQLDYVGGKIS